MEKPLPPPPPIGIIVQYLAYACRHGVVSFSIVMHSSGMFSQHEFPELKYFSKLILYQSIFPTSHLDL